MRVETHPENAKLQLAEIAFGCAKKISCNNVSLTAYFEVKMFFFRPENLFEASTKNNN